MANDPSETGVIRLESAEDFVEYGVELLKPVIRTINILTTDFEREWLGNERFVEQIKLCIVKNRRVHVKLLVADPTQAIRQNHPLIALIRKLSRFEAKVISEEMLDKQPLKKSMILVDRGGVILRQSPNDFIGFVHFDDKHSVKNLTGEFDQYWRFSTTHADLRHVYM